MLGFDLLNFGLKISFAVENLITVTFWALLKIFFRELIIENDLLINISRELITSKLPRTGKIQVDLRRDPSVQISSPMFTYSIPECLSSVMLRLAEILDYLTSQSRDPQINLPDKFFLFYVFSSTSLLVCGDTHGNYHHTKLYKVTV